MKIAEQFATARKRKVPLIAIRTSDPAVTTTMLQEAAVNGTEPPVVVWDCMRGMKGVNGPGEKEATRLAPADPLNPGQNPTVDPVAMLAAAATIEPKSVLIAMNLQMFFQNEQVVQGIWNLRSLYERTSSTFVMIGAEMVLPSILQNDIMLWDEPYPDDELIGNIVRSVYRSANLPEPDEGVVRQSVLASTGMPAFPIKNNLALAITPEGLDMEALNEKRKQEVNATQGLEYESPSVTFADLVGVRNAKSYFSRLLGGKIPIRCIFLLDELEKSVAGTGDTSGVSQAQQELLLSWTSKVRALGILLFGVAGAGKTHTARCLAGEAGAPFLQGSLSAAKAGIVGETESNTRRMLKVVESIGGDGILMVATCNSMTALTPELRARFRLTSFFYDTPDEEERAALWAYFMKKYEVEGPVPESSGWVGREIESCCETAWLLSTTLEEAAQYIVPVSVSSADKIATMRKSAHDTIVSASYPGRYQVDGGPRADDRSIAF